MTTLLLQKADGKECVTNPEYVSVLLNINKVAVDGTIHKDVEAVTYMECEDEDCT